MKNICILTICGAVLIVATSVQANSATYYGNGITNSSQGAFNGAIGAGSLTLTDDGTTVTGTFNLGVVSGARFNNSLTLYIDSVPSGFSDTSGFQDTQDGNRRAISGYTSSTSHSLLTFASGFLPDYAISLEPYTGGGGGDFGGLWQLANGGSGSLPFKQSVNLSPLTTSNAPVYTFSFSLANIGLTPGAGQSFELLGTFDSASGNRSGEAIAGDDMVDPVFSATNSAVKGFIPFVQTSFVTYTTTAVPEPTSLALAGCFGIAALLALRRFGRLS